MNGDPIYVCLHKGCGATLVGPVTRCPMHPKVGRWLVGHQGNELPELDYREQEAELAAQRDEDDESLLDKHPAYPDRADGR